MGHVLYSVDLMSAMHLPLFHLMVHRYIYSRYPPVFLTLYQLYHSLSSSTLTSSSSVYLRVLQPELLLKVITIMYLSWPAYKLHVINQWFFLEKKATYHFEVGLTLFRLQALACWLLRFNCTHSLLPCLLESYSQDQMTFIISLSHMLIQCSGWQ